MRTYRTILVATDFSSRADAALQAAALLAKRQEGSKLLLTHVLDASLSEAVVPYDLTGEATVYRDQAAMDATRERLREVAATLDVESEVVVRKGHPAKELARAALNHAADIIVISTQGHGAVKRAVLGSVTTSLLGYAHCPVLAVGPDRTVAKTEKILAAIDLSPVSPQVLEHAFSFAQQGGGGVRVTSVFDEPLQISGDHPFSLQAYALPARIQRLDEQKEAVGKLVDAVRGESQLPHELSVVAGSPPHLEVLEVIKKTDPDMVVVGASGHRTWSKALFGTNAARIIAGTHVPVLVVPDPSHRASSAGDTPRATEKAQVKEQIVYGMFDPDRVQEVTSKLADASISSEHLSVVMSEDTHSESFQEDDPADTGFLAGGALGTSVGGVLGGLASLSVATGVGLVVVGPAVALGLIGGLIGTLVGYGVPEHDAARLHDAVERGKVLVAVHAFDPEELERAKTVLADSGAQPKRLFLH